MEVPDHIKCDVCLTPKGETNHWLIAVEARGAADNLIGIAFGPADSQFAGPNVKVEHICSHACAVKRFSQWLGTL